jgi:glc operon protein GlcG
VLSITDAKRVAAACRAVAERERWTVSIAVVDGAGNLLYFERNDARFPTADVAIRKARTAAATQNATAALQQRVQEVPGLIALGWLPLQGGLPLMYQGQCVGGVGVSGVTGEQDELAARAGCEALAG